MNSRHLTSQQISEWLLGECKPEVKCHLEACSTCEKELTRLTLVLTQFRGSVRDWSERQMSPNCLLIPQVDHSWMTFNRFCLAMVVLAICIFMSIPLHQANSSFSSEETAPTNAALMTQVDREISRSVPESMEPLAQLVLWDRKSDIASNAGAAQK